MNLEIQNPELVQRLDAHIRTGHFHDTEELIEKALDALDERVPAPESSAAERRHAAGRKSLVEVFAPLCGLNLDFSRNKNGSRPVDLE